MSFEELTKIVNSLRSTLKRESFSPYEMSKIVNESLSIDLPPQMFYNYVKKNMIVSTRDDRNKIIVSKDEVLRFVEKYSLRNLVTTS